MVPGTAPERNDSELHAHQRVQEALVARAKALHLARFGSRRHNQADAEQRFEQKASDVGAALADRLAPAPPDDAGSVASAQTLAGTAATLTRNSRGLSAIMMAALPIRNTTFESTLSRLSAETRCTSAISLLMRETTSPSFRLRPEARRERLQVPVQRQPHVEKH